MSRTELARLELARQMAAIHEARARMSSLSHDERDAHHTLAGKHLREAARLQERAL